MSEPNATILMRERRAENREMPTAGDFTPEEMAATVRTEILRALKAAAVSTEVDRRGLLPAHIILSARFVDSTHSPMSEAFRLRQPNDKGAAVEVIEFHWLLDAPHQVRIVRARPHNTFVQG